MKGIHSLNQEYSYNTAQDYSLSNCEDFIIGTINVQNSNSRDNVATNFENTDNRNSFTERLSDNSSNQVFDDDIKATYQKSISIQNNKK